MEWWIPCCWGNEMRFCEVQKQSGGVQMGAKGEMSYVSNENETVFMMVWGGMILHDGCMMMCENKRGAATNLFFHTTRDTQTMFFFKIEKKYHVKQKVEAKKQKWDFLLFRWLSIFSWQSYKSVVCANLIIAINTTVKYNHVFTTSFILYEINVL